MIVNQRKKGIQVDLNKQLILDTNMVLSGSTSKYQGWLVEGIQHFNDLYDLILELCTSIGGLEFEEKFLLFCEDSKNKKMKNQKKLKM